MRAPRLGRSVIADPPPEEDPMRSLTLVIAAAFVAALVFAVPAKADVVDGGFESPVIQGIADYAAPATLDAWTVVAGGVTLADSSWWAPASGAQSLELGRREYTPPSDVLRQTVAVQPGHRYRLSF